MAARRRCFKTHARNSEVLPVPAGAEMTVIRLVMARRMVRVDRITHDNGPDTQDRIGHTFSLLPQMGALYATLFARTRTYRG